MTLSAQSLEWATQFVADHSDGDLFPRIAEISAIIARKSEFAAEIVGKPLSNFKPGPHRRFIVPKDEVSYRQATHLDPQDTIILSAIVFEYGDDIEAHRRSEKEVFSYRFLPTAQRGLYSDRIGWNNFWETAADNGRRSGCVLVCDISDFYNQIYHHAIENQLIACGLPNQATKWIIGLLESTTAGVSRGVPIGPHAAHLIAEASLIPIDNSMAASGLEFVRYADDIVIFSRSDREARQALGRLAQILDKQQRLTLQRHKTRFFRPDVFEQHCRSMIEDRPINNEEANILRLVRKYSGGNPYATISYNHISAEDWGQFSHELVRKIIEEYIEAEEVDFIRLRWFYRRLAQIGHPGAIDVTLENLEVLTPCFASICAYLSSLQSIDAEQWLGIGSRLLGLLETDQIRESEYFRLSILGLFSRNAELNHFASLSRAYSGSDPSAKREILLAAKTSGAVDWIRELKENFGAMDPWQKLAFLFCCADLPSDERKYFINRWSFDRPFEAVLARWAKSSAP